MDPWMLPRIGLDTSQEPTEEPRELQVELQGEHHQDNRLQFENSFLSGHSQKSENLICFEKLPDSAEYLSRLEAKLGKLQGAREGKVVLRNSSRSAETDLVEGLSEARESALAALVNCDTSVWGRTGEEVEEEQEVRTGYIARRLVPQQPLTQGEQVVLTRADHLEKQLEQEQDREELSDH